MSRDSLSEERKKLQAEGVLPEWFTTDGYSLFKQKYAVAGEQSFLGRAKTIAKTAASYMPKPSDWEDKFFNLIWKGWLSCSTPVLSNTGTDRGMSVSCSGQYVGDSVSEFYSNLHESAVLSKNGFGTSAYLGDIRPRGSKITIGGKASGILPVIQDFVTMSNKVSQGSQRRGAFAGYIDIDHGDFDEIADYAKNHPDDLNIGWVWKDSDTSKAQAGDEETIRRFKKALKLKMLTGKGYFFFVDKVNRANPESYIKNDLTVKSSNLCTEITLYQDEFNTYSCVLSSMNIAKYNEWKDTDAVFTAIVFLDCIAEDFIQKAKDIHIFEKIIRFTKKGRALGLGACGFHTYLQDNMIAFESVEAQLFNSKLFKDIKEEAVRASEYLAKELGEPEWCKGLGYRNTHLLAIAPTMSTALLMSGISQGIEPVIGNVFIQAGAGGEVERVNPSFLKIMKERGKYNRKLMKHIADNYGSVQDQDWLTDEEKLVFRTAFEINQSVILRLAAHRQKYICQGQSLNLFFSAEESEEVVAAVHKEAILNENIKALYYVRTQSGVKAGNSECVACQ